MRVLLSTIGSRGDVQPLVALALFKRVAAVVHHGGAGTTTAAAQRIHHLGIGTAHAPGTPSADSLTSALEHTFQPDVAARARSVAAAVRSDGAKAAAQGLTAAGRGV